MASALTVLEAGFAFEHARLLGEGVDALLCWSSGLLQHTCKFEVSVLLDFVGCYAKERSTFRQSSERLPCRVKSELNCFEHYNRHHTTENVACQKTNAQFQEGENAVTQNTLQN